MTRFLLAAWIVLLASTGLDGQELPGDRMVADYFAKETAALQGACLADIQTLEQWNQKREQFRNELHEMLGLSPLPERTDLRANVVGREEIKQHGFAIERVQFQSRPGLYVTGTLYLPLNIDKPAPAILYVCGHGRVKEDGISYGSKAHYQHHGAWFARNGYVCLTIDTLQLGELEGIHHGTYRYDRWWWLNRGYTPAGVEAWNCVRALDYLETRPEVDKTRMGVTGRSGGGAYSWWIAAIDDRIKAAVPVAGITDLENHVVDGCVEGHCDCMFMVNTFRWDYSKVAALVAPRPLLISNTDRDRIFPLEGVVRTHAAVRKIYRLHKAEDKLALHITAGPHKDTQELRVHAFRWFNHFLKNDDALVETTATKFLEPKQLRVFAPGKEPEDERNTKIDETFVTAAPSPTPPQDKEAWSKRSAEVRRWLDSRVFAGWPQNPGSLELSQAFSESREGLRLEAWDFTSQHPFRLRLYVLANAKVPTPKLTVLNVNNTELHRRFLSTVRPKFADQLSEEPPTEGDEIAFESTRKMLLANPWAMAYVAPRGVGRTRWNPDKRKQTQHRRRFYLLGQSLHGMQIYDIRRAMQAVRATPQYGSSALWLQSEGTAGVQTLYASLYEPQVARIDVHRLPTSHRNGPYLLNISRAVTIPEIVALAGERSRIVGYGPNKSDFDYAQKTAAKLEWGKKQIQWRTLPSKE